MTDSQRDDDRDESWRPYGMTHKVIAKRNIERLREMLNGEPTPKAAS